MLEERRILQSHQKANVGLIVLFQIVGVIGECALLLKLHRRGLLDGRFIRYGWALSGEFGLLYFFANFVNEIADILFTIPQDSFPNGGLIRFISIALEFFQLGVLFPTTAFEHKDCLRYVLDKRDPDFRQLKDVLVGFMKAIWLAAVTFGGCIVLGVGLGMCCFSLLQLVLQLETLPDGAKERIKAFLERAEKDQVRLVIIVVTLGCGPLFVIGVYYGILVVSSQMSKGGADLLTGILLLGDLLTKYGLATAVFVALKVRECLHPSMPLLMEVPGPCAPQLLDGRAVVFLADSRKSTERVRGHKVLERCAHFFDAKGRRMQGGELPTGSAAQSPDPR
jgi:hypothetical protein